MNITDNTPFEGAKVALFLGEQLVVILRDDFAGLPFAGHWDLPGGGREGGETPFACVARECMEELGLEINVTDVVWSKVFGSAVTASGVVWFFAAHQPETSAQDIVFGDEGQRWTLMHVDEFLNHPKAVPAFQSRVRLYLTEEKPYLTEEKSGFE